MILDANFSITPEYRNEFEKCSQPEFVEFGDFEIEEALKTYPVPLLYRLSFWIPAIFIIFAFVLVFLFYWCLSQIQQRIERNKKSQFALLENQGIFMGSNCPSSHWMIQLNHHIVSWKTKIYLVKVVVEPYTKENTMESMWQSRKLLNGILLKNSSGTINVSQKITNIGAILNFKSAQ